MEKTDVPPVTFQITLTRQRALLCSFSLHFFPLCEILVLDIHGHVSSEQKFSEKFLFTPMKLVFLLFLQTIMEF